MVCLETAEILQACTDTYTNYFDEQLPESCRKAGEPCDTVFIADVNWPIT